MKNGQEPRKKILIIENLKEYLEQEINNYLFQVNTVDGELFLCSSYIASIVSEFSKHFPKMWRAAEEFLKGQKEKGYNPWELESGGKKCFIICSFFPEIIKRRRVSNDYYSKFGASLFFMHYLRTDREISYHMANWFNDLVDITNEVICAST